MTSPRAQRRPNHDNDLCFLLNLAPAALLYTIEVHPQEGPTPPFEGQPPEFLDEPQPMTSRLWGPPPSSGARSKHDFAHNDKRNSKMY